MIFRLAVLEARMAALLHLVTRSIDSAAKTRILNAHVGVEAGENPARSRRCNRSLSAESQTLPRNVLVCLPVRISRASRQLQWRVWACGHVRDRSALGCFSGSAGPTRYRTQDPLLHWRRSLISCLRARSIEQGPAPVFGQQGDPYER